MKRAIFLLSYSIFCVSTLYAQSDTSTVKKENTQEKKLDEALVMAKKKAITRTADRTIFDFSEQPSLNSGSLYDGLKKIPGLIISDVVGMIYQGKQLEVYLDGRPLNIYTDELQNYLNSMPANSVERIEVITNPGAEFPATSGGAILNIISSRYYQKYLSSTYSGGYQFSDYNKLRNRFNNSLMIQAGSNKMAWQLRVGQSYTERFVNNRYSINSNLSSSYLSDMYRRYYFVESGLKFNIKQDRIILNYNLGYNDNSAYIDGQVPGQNLSDLSITNANRHDLSFNYQKRFRDYNKKLDFGINFIRNNNDFKQSPNSSSGYILKTDTRRDFLQFKSDYTQKINLLDESKILLGVLAEKVDFGSQALASFFKYYQNTLAGYFEAQSKYKGFDFILGGRVENYELKGKTDQTDLYPFSQTPFFPNATVQYTIAPEVYISTKYSRKIHLPSTAALNPNNNIYQNPNISFEGNPLLKPTLFSNYSIEASAYEYFSLGYTQTAYDNQVMFRILQTNNSILRTYQNIAQCTQHNFYLGIPLPFILFTQGLKKTLELDYNPDNINFLYLYTGYTKQNIPDLQTQGVWYLNLMTQLILPQKIKFSAYYSTSTREGNYYYIIYDRPFRKSVDINFSRKFDQDRFSVSLFVNDIFNMNSPAYSAAETQIMLSRKEDTRRFGLSLSYKFPTRGKTKGATEDLLRKQDESEILPDIK